MSLSSHPVPKNVCIRKILCPTDFSASAQRAFEYATGMAGELQAELLLLHAFEVPDALTIAGQTHGVAPEIRAELEALRPDSQDVTVSHVLHAGPAGEVICWLAEQRHCDLIVMGTHGRSGLKHLLFGSIAEYVMRHARCPVLTIRERPEHEPPLREPLVLPLPPPRFM